MHAAVEAPFVPAISRRVVFATAFAVLLSALPLMPFSNDYIIAVAVRALLFIMLGQAWNIIAGIGGQLSLGHGVFFGVGAYGTVLLFNQAEITPWIGSWVAALVAIAVAIVMGAATFRLKGVYFALGTIAISLGFEKIARQFVRVTGGDAGLAERYLRDAPWAMQFNSAVPFFWIALLLVWIYYLLTVWLIRSELGFRLRAVRDDEAAASAAGVNVFQTKMIGLMLSAAMTSLAGSLYVQAYLSIDPGTAFGLFQAIQIQLPSLIGGIGTGGGPVIGGAIMIILSELTNWGSSILGVQGLDILAYGIVLLGVVSYAPAGLFVTIRRRRRTVAVADVTP